MKQIRCVSCEQPKIYVSVAHEIERLRAIYGKHHLEMLLAF